MRSWTEGIKSQLQADAIVCSKSLARRRFRFRHAKIRSTTQRRGRITKPLVRSDRLMISIVQSPILVRAALSFPPAYLHQRTHDAATESYSGHLLTPMARRLGLGCRRCEQWHEPESHSCRDDMALAAFHFLARIISPYPATFRCFDRQAIDHASTG